MATPLGCRLRRHAWMQRDGATLVCRRCGAERRRRKTLLCRLGSHRWVPVAKEGQRYLECRRCGAYGGAPADFSWGRRNPYL